MYILYMVGFDWMMNQIFTHRKWWFNHSIHLKLVVWASRFLFHPDHKKTMFHLGWFHPKTVSKLWLINQPSPKRTTPSGKNAVFLGFSQPLISNNNSVCLIYPPARMDFRYHQNDITDMENTTQKNLHNW